MSEVSVPAAFTLALQQLHEWLEGEGVAYVAIGGIAVSLLAQPRATQDIDVVIWLDQEQWGRLLESGARCGFEVRLTDALEFAERARVLLFQHSASGINVDISCGALPFEHEMIERAQTLRIGEFQLRVPTPEDLVITKAVAGRAKDIADVESLINVYPDLNVERVRYWVREFAEALEMPDLLNTIERLLSK